MLRWFDVSGIRIRFVAPTRACKKRSISSSTIRVIGDALLPDLSSFSRADTLDSQVEGHER